MAVHNRYNTNLYENHYVSINFLLVASLTIGNQPPDASHDLNNPEEEVAMDEYNISQPHRLESGLCNYSIIFNLNK